MPRLALKINNRRIVPTVAATTMKGLSHVSIFGNLNANTQDHRRRPDCLGSMAAAFRIGRGVERHRTLLHPLTPAFHPGINLERKTHAENHSLFPSGQL